MDPLNRSTSGRGDPENPRIARTTRLSATGHGAFIAPNPRPRGKNTRSSISHLLYSHIELEIKNLIFDETFSGIRILFNINNLATSSSFECSVEMRTQTRNKSISAPGVRDIDEVRNARAHDCYPNPVPVMVMVVLIINNSKKRKWVFKNPFMSGD
ncbi:hypothetical protein BDD12DRAFT_273669 [Trichophaea hybrida]|nr:hypothetical protein BDD12DRAFT_273669 [Trichophaea hybrida]